MQGYCAMKVTVLSSTLLRKLVEYRCEMNWLRNLNHLKQQWHLLATCRIHFVMDNFDLRQEVKDMTAGNQNKDYHWTNHNCIKNRVSGINLASDKPICKLSDLPNGSVLPQAKDHINNRENYIVLVERIIVDYIPALNFLKSTF